MIKKTLLLFSTVALSACSITPQSSQIDPLVSHIDSAISPGENFFLYANNRWFTENPIPGTKNSVGIFRTIQDTINSQVRQVCEKSAALTNAEKGSKEQMIGDYYAAGLDTNTIEKNGLSALKEQLDMINAITSPMEITSAAAKLHVVGCSPLFNFRVGIDDKNSSAYAAFFYQGGIGLPDREYYFSNEGENPKIRTEYVKHIQNMLSLAKLTSSKDAGVKVFAIEKSLAQASRKLEDTRDPYKNYNKVSVRTFTNRFTVLNTATILSTYQLNNIDSVIIGQPEFFTALESALMTNSLADWKLYLQWNLISSYSDKLTKNLDIENFNFFGKVLSGRKAQKPRWERIVEDTDGSLGELIGQIYVKEYLPEGTKEKLLEIGENIRTVYAEHIKQLDWMSATTKEKALSKLAKVNMKVGYPDKWKDMSSINIDRTSYAKNSMSVRVWQFNDMISKYGKPVDKSEWGMTPQMYNAYYDPTFNEICVPACNIIVPGFEGRMPDDAVVYGIIGGSTFGHELTHGFDDQGSLYDETGNLRDWWTKEDREKFVAKTKMIVEQYSQYTVLNNLHINGEATQGENIADLGGLVMGYEAFKKTKQGQSTEKIGGYTPDQRFFLGYAYAWMVNYTKESLEQRVMSDVHSPSEFRVNGVVANMPEFHNAFGVKAGDKMHRAESAIVKIW
jgi:putative endopeptidase